MKRETKVSLLMISKREMPTSFDELRAFSARVAAAVPAIDAAINAGHNVTFWDEDDYETGWEHLEVYYRRPETDQEEAERLQREAADEGKRRLQREAEERAQLARLKAKYGE